MKKACQRNRRKIRSELSPNPRETHRKQRG